MAIIYQLPVQLIKLPGIKLNRTQIMEWSGPTEFEFNGRGIEHRPLLESSSTFDWVWLLELFVTVHCFSITKQNWTQSNRMSLIDWMYTLFEKLREDLLSEMNGTCYMNEQNVLGSLETIYARALF